MRPRTTFANVVSVLALFVALRGTALATHPGGQNTISSAGMQKRRTLEVMSEEHVEIVRRAYEAFNQGDLDGLLGFVDPEIEVRPDPDLPDWRVFEGREGFLSFAGAWLEPWDSYSIEIERLVGAADRVMAITRETAGKQDTGIEVDQRVHHVWTLRDRRAVRWEVFYDPTRALEAAGLSG